MMRCKYTLAGSIRCMAAVAGVLLTLIVFFPSRDVYEKMRVIQAEAWKLLKKAGLFRKVDPKKVEQAVLAGTGIPKKSRPEGGKISRAFF